MTGRTPCPACGSRATERTTSTERQNRLVCLDCDNEWQEYCGPDCPNCGCNNTTEERKSGLGATGTEIVCYECGWNNPWR